MTPSPAPHGWWRHARCATSRVDFFPASGAEAAAAPARAVCAACPVRAACLHAHLSETDGIWGGTRGAEREHLRDLVDRLAADTTVVDAPLIRRRLRKLLDVGLPPVLLADVVGLNPDELEQRAGVAAA
jgi:hypothetical protein